MPLSEFMLRDDEYLHWVKSRKPATWNLVTSGLLPVKWCELGLDSGELEITGHAPYGHEPLIERLAFRYGTPTKNVMTALGTSGANFLALGALIEPGDRVLIESPTYEPMWRAAEFLGARLEFFERRFEHGYALDPERIARAVTPDTRVVFVSNLHNPSGRYTDEQTMLEVGRVAAQVGAYVLADEVYQEFIPNARPAFQLGDNFISTNSLTKVYGLGGLRCGWVLARENVIERCRRMTNISYGETPLLSDLAGCRALDRVDWLAARSRNIIAQNRPLVDAFMERNRELLEWVAPGGGTICFPRLKRGTGTELARVARERYDTDVAAGCFFEAPRDTNACDRHVRISFGGETRGLEEGLVRLGHAIGDLAGNGRKTSGAAV